MGWAYYFNPSFFVDLNYTATMSQHYTVSDAAPFTSTFTQGGNTYSSQGSFTFDDFEDLVVQSVMLSVNKSF